MKSGAIGFIVLLGLSLTLAAPASTDEKKPLGDVEPALKTAKIAEGTPAIAIEDAEEPKQGDRTKKSASTTFCVEIRPGPSEKPVKVCEDSPSPTPPPAPTPVPQVHHEVHQVHEQPPPHIPTPEGSFCIIPPNPSELYIPNEPCPPQFLPQYPYFNYPPTYHYQPAPQNIIIPPPVQRPCPQSPPQPPQQHVVIPSVVSNPCPHSAQIPQAPQQQIIIPGPAAYPQSPCPPSPCAATSGSGLHPQALLALYRSAMTPMDSEFASMGGMQMRSNTGNDASGMYSGAMMSPQMESKQDFGSGVVGMPFGRTFTPIYGLPSTSYYPPQYSINQISPYTIRDPHLMTYSTRVPAYATQINEWYKYGNGAFNGMNYNGQSANAAKVTPPTGHVHRREEQRHQEPEPKQKATEESSRSNSESRAEKPITLSPSQMLNQMRGSGGTSGFNVRPMMQTFPRNNEDRSSDEGVNVNMNIPRGGQPFMMSAPRHGLEEKKMDIDDGRAAKGDEMGKRQADKSASD